MSSKESIPMVKSDDHKFWKLDMLAKFSESILEEKERAIGTTVKSSPTPPEWLMEVMMKVKEKNAHDPKLIIEKRLHASDLSKVQSRLSMPINQLLSSDFLTEEEKTILHEQPDPLNGRKEEGRKSVSVVLVDPRSEWHEVELRRWKMGANWNYVVVGGWNKVISCNKFKVDDVTVIWSFRYGGGKLCLALSPLVRDSKHSGQSSSRRS